MLIILVGPLQLLCRRSDLLIVNFFGASQILNFLWSKFEDT